MSEHPPQTPNELYDAYQSAAKLMPRPWRWWYVRKARRAREASARRRDEALRRALEHDLASGPKSTLAASWFADDEGTPCGVSQPMTIPKAVIVGRRVLDVGPVSKEEKDGSD